MPAEQRAAPPLTPAAPPPHADLAIVGAGAAGLMAAVWAGRTAPAARIVVLDGARTLGAKILVAGGGRCNVTHHEVDATAYAGSTPAAIRRVLRRFDVEATVAFFAERGVALKREETGKLFPTTDRAQTVLDALLGAVGAAGAEVFHPYRVHAVAREVTGFRLEHAGGRLRARRVILATGGLSLPRSGSDGHGLAMARALGHRLTEHLFPALVPLLLPQGHPLRALSGLAAPATLTLRAGTGRVLTAFTGPVLCTHFGLSGPAVLDVSRYWTAARVDDAAATLSAHWLPGLDARAVEAALQGLGRATPLAWLRDLLPERLARLLVEAAGLDAATPGAQLPRAARRALAGALTAYPLPVCGDRGFRYAEVTAGGVPLAELHLGTLASRRCPGLHLCGELCDVDGRIGGFNFQWAWASGYVAGTAAARALADPS